MRLGTVLTHRDGFEYVYIGARRTSVGTRERVFARIVDGVYWPACLRTYKASDPVTLKRVFPDLDPEALAS